MKNLPDIIDYNLKVLFIGFNPGMKSAEVGHHYAGASNNFWKLLYESGITPYRLKAEEDSKLLESGYGSTNIIRRPTRSASELKKQEFVEGSLLLKEVLQRYKPQIACYVGKGIYKMFKGVKSVDCGRQEVSVVEGVVDYVCSSPSGLNRESYSNQLACFIRLKTVMDDLCT